MKSKLLGQNNEVQYYSGHIVVPLVLSPFLENQLLSMDLDYHCLEIIVEFEWDVKIPQMDIMGNKYFMKQNKNPMVINQDCFSSPDPLAFPRPVSMLSPQTLFYPKAEKIMNNQICISCPMLLPTSVLMLWSTALCNVDNIEISLDEHVLYNGNVKNLHAYTNAKMKTTKNELEQNPVCFFMCDPKNIPDAGITSKQILPNFSTVNNVNIILKMKEGSCKEDEIFDVDITTLSYNFINFMNNMCGVAFV